MKFALVVNDVVREVREIDDEVVAKGRSIEPPTQFFFDQPEGAESALGSDPTSKWVELTGSEEVAVGWTMGGRGKFHPPSEQPDDAIARQRLGVLDASLPRCMEDLIDALGVDTSKLPPEMRERLKEKRELRTSIQKSSKAKKGK